MYGYVRQLSDADVGDEPKKSFILLASCNPGKGLQRGTYTADTIVHGLVVGGCAYTTGLLWCHRAANSVYKNIL